MPVPLPDLLLNFVVPVAAKLLENLITGRMRTSADGERIEHLERLVLAWIVSRSATRNVSDEMRYAAHLVAAEVRELASRHPRFDVVDDGGATIRLREPAGSAPDATGIMELQRMVADRRAAIARETPRPGRTPAAGDDNRSSPDTDHLSDFVARVHRRRDGEDVDS